MSRQSILKWGNSLAFRLPAAIARQLEVREGSAVTYRVHGKRLIIEPAAEALPEFTQKTLRREALKAKSSPANWGAPKGREVW